MTAAMFNRTEIVDLLLERGADIDRRDASGHTAMTAAQIMNAPDTPSQLARAAERRHDASATEQPPAHH
jgi:ankyrin repeat protein